MDFLDEDARPRVLFQSRPQPPPETLQNPKKQYIFITITTTISSLILLLSTLYLQTEPFQSLLFWLSLSLFLGPFAPSHLTAGHIRVGHGPILQPLTPPQPEPEKKPHQKRSKQPVRSDQIFTIPALPIPIPIPEHKNNNVLGLGLSKEQNGIVLEETEWSEEDFEVLKKQLVKNPVGKIGRWEVIAEAFKGRHKVESVVKKAKEMSERRLDGGGGGDDYARFLKNRKPLDVRGNNENELLVENVDESKKENDNNWSSGEDIALLNALKAFPKDVAMRWDKIAAAVPGGKTKAACVKRVAELKRDFRSSKAGAES